MRLTLKIILIIGVTVSVIVSLVFWVINQQFERQVEKHLLTTARAVYDNIVIMRKWVSDKEGVFVIKTPQEQTNAFLPHPDLYTVLGDTLILKNPALVTRELSELSRTIGKEFSYHLASLNYINPVNQPDDFEKEALLFFEKNGNGEAVSEFFHFQQIDSSNYFRYFAPLYTGESCLTCHADQGYELGDLRGGISIILPTEQYRLARRSQIIFFSQTWIITAILLVTAIFFAIRYSVIRPLRAIEYSAERIQKGDYDHQLTLRSKDEIGHTAEAFENMRMTIKEYTGRLRASEAKYRDLIENSPEAVAIVDRNERIIECSSKLSRLTGYDDTTLKERHLNELLMSEKTSPIGAKDPSGNMVKHFETMLETREKLHIPVEIYSIAGFSLEKNNDLTFVYIRDLTERKKVEKYALQTEKMFALGQISSGIAHEIRNPLFAMNNNLDYLKNRYGDSPDFQEIYPEFLDAVKRIEAIVSAILDYSRPHELSFRKISVEDVINQSLLLVQKQFEKSSIQIQTDFKAEKAEIIADPYKLEQVFLNLFLNAFQAMKEAGVLTVSTENQDSKLLISVKDTGQGIPKEELERVFDPFFSKSPNGTGLGMSIVQRILEQHKAIYRIESEVGYGTHFYILFNQNRIEHHEV